MQKYAFAVVVILAAAIAVLVFRGQSTDEPIAPPMTTQSNPHAQMGMTDGSNFSGKIIETMDAGGYTYVHLDNGSEKIWAAGPQTAVTVGTVVSVATGMLMEDFTSEKLNRTFDELYFVPEIVVAGGEPSHPPVSSNPEVSVDLSGISVPDGGSDIATLYSEKSKLSGKKVVVRGRVVKFTPGVMGKNWVHLRDGSGTEGTNDLTITTDYTVGVGESLVAEGLLTIDKDYGFGYEYEVIIEDAKITVD